MEQSKTHNQAHQHDAHDHRDHARRDDMQWTQYITNLAANKLSQPRSQTLKILEQQLARLNEELVIGDSSRVKERLAPSGEQRSDGTANEQRREGDGSVTGAQNALAVGVTDPIALNTDNGLIVGTASLGTGSSDTNTLRFAGAARVERVNPQVQSLNQEMLIGSRWVDVLWQFIVTNQKRVIDLERLGIEPSERMDLQVDMIRQIAATYEKLGLLTRLPDSLHEAHECKKVDDIRTMALVYVARKMMDVASPKEIADENDDGSGSKNKKQRIDFPRSVISPYEGIRPIEFDPAEFLRSAA
jgi:hypothetical protein